MLKPSDIRTLKGVANTRNLTQEHLQLPLDLIFWICPNIRKNGWRFNKETNSLVTRFDPGLSDRGKVALEKSLSLRGELQNQGVEISTTTALFATADAILLVENPLEVPQPPRELANSGAVISTIELIDYRYLLEWSNWRRTKPWNNVPGSFTKMETERLRTIPWNSTPAWAVTNWIERIFAGYAQDGIWSKRFFVNPVIAGVESPGVSVLQNAALSKSEWIPVIQLK